MSRALDLSVLLLIKSHFLLTQLGDIVSLGRDKVV